MFSRLYARINYLSSKKVFHTSFFCSKNGLNCIQRITFMTLRCTALAILLINYITAISQDANIRTFATNSVYSESVLSKPEWIDRKSCTDFQIPPSEEFFKEIELIQATVPVVFHFVGVVAEKPDIIRATNNQLTKLNQIFRKLPVYFSESAKTPTLSIRFELAKSVGADYSQGNVFSEGIIFYAGSKTWPLNHNLQNPEAGGVKPIQTPHFLNIWVSELESPSGGFAQYPGGPEETDGIVIDWDFFGSKENSASLFNDGKTLVHLVGNYFNLNEIWGTGSLCSDDGIADTPLQNAPNVECYSGRHISTCSGYSVEDISNYMDAAPDTCMKHFTPGQINRMLTTLLWPGGRNFITYMGKEQSDSVIIAQEFFKVRPNPSPGEFTLTTPPAFSRQVNLKLEILSVIGKREHQQTVTIGPSEDIRLNLSFLPEGVYNLHAQWDQGAFVEKLIILK
ncbi:MAG: M43 family zinc metalloprotease [Bacteroidia bacterium]